MKTPISSGAMLGIVGGGGTSRMLSAAARQMGYRVAVLDPDLNDPAAQVADLAIAAETDDEHAILDLARNVEALAVQCPGVPLQTLVAAASRTSIYPHPESLHVTEHRASAMSFLVERGFPVVRHAEVKSMADLHDAVGMVGLPALLKPAARRSQPRQRGRLLTSEDIAEAWNRVGRRDSVLEREVAIDAELVVIVARAADGQMATYGPIRNIRHRQLHEVSQCPADIPPSTDWAATDMARNIAAALNATGMLAVEMFLLTGDELVVDQLTPWLPDSVRIPGEAFATSPYAQFVRILGGLPLGSAELLKPASSVGVSGSLWDAGEPNWQACLSDPRVHLTLYSKRLPRPETAMGHLTCLAESGAEASEAVRAARERLVAAPTESASKATGAIRLTRAGGASSLVAPPPPDTSG